jgi:hypothetical protein
VQLIACSTALAAAVAFSLPRLACAGAGNVQAPDAPPDIRVPEGNIPFLVGHAIGMQNYICRPCPNASTPLQLCPDGSGFAWILFAPEATLFADNDDPLITHYFSPNPDEGGTIRATWRDSRDSSIVWGGKAVSSNDSQFVKKNSVAWLKLPMAGVQDGPTGDNTLAKTTFIQRVHTFGGVAPRDGCSDPRNVGDMTFQPYVADYFFWTKAPGSDANQ